MKLKIFNHYLEITFFKSHEKQSDKKLNSENNAVQFFKENPINKNIFDDDTVNYFKNPKFLHNFYVALTEIILDDLEKAKAFGAIYLGLHLENISGYNSDFKNFQFVFETNLNRPKEYRNPFFENITLENAGSNSCRIRFSGLEKSFGFQQFSHVMIYNKAHLEDYFSQTTSEIECIKLQKNNSKPVASLPKML